MDATRESEPTIVRTRVRRDDLRLFSSSIGETRPMYVSVRAARSAGHPDLPVPPTYLFGLVLRTGSPFDWAVERGFDMQRTLHAEQCFEYVAMTFAGDTLTLTSSCDPVETTRRSRALRLTRRTVVRRSDEVVAHLSCTLVQPGTRP